MAAAQAEEPNLHQLQERSTLKLQQVPLAMSDGATLLCDVSTGVQRPVVPHRFRRPVFDALHSLSHPGIRASQRLISQHFVWPGVNKDVRQWARSCLQCQRAKIHRHTRTPPGTFTTPDARLIMSILIWWAPYLPPVGSHICLHVWIASCAGLKQCPLPTVLLRQLPRLSFRHWHTCHRHN